MSRLTRDVTAEPVSRDRILRHERGQGNIHFSCTVDHVQGWQPYPVDPYSCLCVTIHHGNSPLPKPTGVQIATKSLPGPTTQEHRKLIGAKTMSSEIVWSVCFLPIHSGHQVRWTYQPGSHRRKVTQDF